MWLLVFHASTQQRDAPDTISGSSNGLKKTTTARSSSIQIDFVADKPERDKSYQPGGTSAAARQAAQICSMQSNASGSCDAMHSRFNNGKTEKYTTIELASHTASQLTRSMRMPNMLRCSARTKYEPTKNVRT